LPDLRLGVGVSTSGAAEQGGEVLFGDIFHFAEGNTTGFIS
jgi:hypothetical protein